MDRKSLRTVRRSTYGNTYFETGVVVNRAKAGCPEVDSVYFQFARRGEATYTLCLTPGEADLIARMLLATVHSLGGSRE